MKVLSWLMISALTVLTASADFVFTQAPSLVSKTDNSVTIEWESIEGSMGCYYSYSNTSVENGEEGSIYDVEWEDLLEENTATIENLEAGKTYYIAIECLDEEANTTGYSPELVVDLTSEEEVVMEEEVVEEENEEVTEEESFENTEFSSSLELLDVSFVNSKELKLSFNNDLEDSETAVREIRVFDGINELEVMNASLADSKTLDLELATDMTTSTNYEITVISLNDINGNNIEAWVDGTTTLMSPSEFVVEEVVVEEVVVEEEIIEEWIDLNAASSEVEKLPDTGAKEIFLVLIALLLWVVAINFNKRTS